MVILLEVTPKYFYREDQDLHLINTWSFINDLLMNYLENLYYNKNILYSSLNKSQLFVRCKSVSYTIYNIT
jgi:hypothetical protein